MAFLIVFAPWMIEYSFLPKEKSMPQVMWDETADSRARFTSAATCSVEYRSSAASLNLAVPAADKAIKIHNIETTTTSSIRVNPRSSDIELENGNVAVLDDVALPFCPDEPLGLGIVPSAGADQVLPVNDICRDEPALEVRVDSAGRPWR